MYKRNQWRMKPHTGLSEDDAALKIQSGFRGKKSRKRVVKIGRAQKQDYDDPECAAAAVKMQAGARGRKSRKRANQMAHQKKMSDLGYTAEHELAATKIQKIGRGKKDKKKVEAIKQQRAMQAELAALDGENQEVAALKIQGAARSKKARKRAEKRRLAKERVAGMAKEEYKPSPAEEAAAVKIQTRKRMKRDKARVEKRAAAKTRLEEMKKEEKVWDPAEAEAAKKIQTMNRIKRDKQRCKDIRDGKISAFESRKVYLSGDAKVTLIFPTKEAISGTFKVEKKGFTACAGTFSLTGQECELSPAQDDMKALKIEVNDEKMDFAVQGTDNWLTNDL